MKNDTINAIQNDSDFSSFLNSRFQNPVTDFDFPEGFKERTSPKSGSGETDDQDGTNTIDLQLIRENIFAKHDFDIYDFPIVVYYEGGQEQEYLRPFKSVSEAQDFSKILLNQGTHSLVISLLGGFLLTRLTRSGLVPLRMAILVTLTHQHSGTQVSKSCFLLTCVQGQVAHGGGSAHVWGGVHHLGKNQICVFGPYFVKFWNKTWSHICLTIMAITGCWLIIMLRHIGLTLFMNI